MESGARAAISGYRRQALYTASLLTRKCYENSVFQPEGHEDLDIYLDGRLDLAVQVKAYTSPLKLSDLKPQKEGSFFRRLLTLKNDTNAQLASFGPLGPELTSLQNGDEEAQRKITEKLVGYCYTATEIKQIFNRLTIVCVNEHTIKHEVFNFLSKTATAGNPEQAFDLLTWWLLQAAEKRTQITPGLFRNQIQAIGKYLCERKAHHDEWFATIKPLESQQDPRGLSCEILEQEYYKGVAARYSHIQAGLDVRRDELLQAIDNHFQQGKKVVILHGASGQGKTSLALRYLHEYVPNGWRFLVSTIDSRKHAARIANAFADHLYALTFPLYVLIDVAPRDLDWVALVRELIDYGQIRILVTIREEDLARQTSSPHELGFPANIRLEFGPTEAKPIYEILVQQKEASNVFPTFEEAWERFGGEGPLLEFVHLLTQTESLRSVLEAQVYRIREEIQAGKRPAQILRILHLCAVANAFEARVLLRPVAEHLKLADPAGIVRLLEGEYLLRIDKEGHSVEALHPIRSTLLADIMRDPVFSPQTEMIIEVQPFIPEKDLEIFLLYTFSRHPECWERLFTKLLHCTLSTWSGAAGIGRALMWIGLKSYLIENKQTLAEYSSLPGCSNGLLLILPDFAGASTTDPHKAFLELLDDQNSALAKRLRALKKELSSRKQAFDPLRIWLKNFQIKVDPTSPQEWESLAELAYWAGHFGINPPYTLKLADIPIESLPIETVSKICLAMAKNDYEEYTTALQDQGDRLRKRFQEQTATPLLSDDENNITAHFIVKSNPIASVAFSGRDQNNGITNDTTTNRYNQEAVWHASLLHSLFPDKSRFCTQGYGHQLGIEGLELPFDDTKKRMPAGAFPTPWLVKVNSTISNLWIYERRPQSWKQYADIMLKKRELVAEVLLKLKRSLTSYFEKNKPRSLFGGSLSIEIWQKAISTANDIPNLPTSTVDEWGLSSETQDRSQEELSSKLDKQDRFSTTVPTLETLIAQRPLTSALHDYFIALGNFFNQGSSIGFFHGFFGRQPEKEASLRKQAENAGYSEHYIRLSKINLFSAMQKLSQMQETFDKRVGPLVNQTKLEQIKRRETGIFPELWALWFQFCENPERQFVNAPAQALTAFENISNNILTAMHESIPNYDSWRAKVLNVDFRWERERALVIQLEVESINLLEEGKRELFAFLEKELGGVDFVSLHAFTLQYNWKYILVVPTTNGHVIGTLTWVLPSSSFAGLSEEKLVDRGWLSIPHPLNSKQINDLGLKTGETNSANLLNKFCEISGKLRLCFAHLSGFLDLAPELDSTGQQILNDYFTKLNPWLNELLNQYHNLAPKVCQLLLNSELVEQGIAEEVASEIEQTNMAIKNFSEEGRSIGFNDFTQLKEVFEEQANIAMVTSCLCLQRNG